MHHSQDFLSNFSLGDASNLSFDLSQAGGQSLTLKSNDEHVFRIFSFDDKRTLEQAGLIDGSNILLLWSFFANPKSHLGIFLRGVIFFSSWDFSGPRSCFGPREDSSIYIMQIPRKHFQLQAIETGSSRNRFCPAQHFEAFCFIL